MFFFPSDVLMQYILSRWFNVYEEETRLFFWTTALSFLFSSSSVVLNIYTETAFLIRFGVEYLPTVTIINSTAGIFVVFLMAGLLSKMTSTEIMSWMFVFFVFPVAIFRFLTPAGINLIYPSLYILKLQYESLLLLLFLNLANDLFNPHQMALTLLGPENHDKKEFEKIMFNNNSIS